MLMQTLNHILEENKITKRDTHHLPVNIEENACFAPRICYTVKYVKIERLVIIR